jgi:hypothetical protein
MGERLTVGLEKKMEGLMGLGVGKKNKLGGGSGGMRSWSEEGKG